MTPAETQLAPTFWSPARRRRYLVYTAVGISLVSLGELASWSDDHALLVNATTSLPNWAFMIDRQRVPVRGDFIFFEPPPGPLLARHFGAHPQPFGKIVYGTAGDRVERHGRLFSINARPVALAKPATRFGEPLSLGPTGIIPRGCYFVGTPHRDSFDSRYAAIGWVCRPRIIGVGRAIL
ncbi:S26 family signal peptidase [Sphingomonas sp. NPDC079357]|uniref:S26 family signal peptidase n=1 Tax=Sphingomonas sp. NPDC079357 TaxID=3364518 RepID=UPI00384EFD8B